MATQNHLPVSARPHAYTFPPRNRPTLYVHRAPAAAKDLKVARLRVSFGVASNGG
jgi:hypothetical protein